MGMLDGLSRDYSADQKTLRLSEKYTSYSGDFQGYGVLRCNGHLGESG